MQALPIVPGVEPTLEALLDSLPMGALLLRDLIVVHWNQTLADWTGLPRR